jgi:hypothetical protein
LCRARSARESATRTFAELLIDCEEDRTLRAVLVGMLREREILDLGPLELGDHPGHQGCGSTM